MDVDAGRGGLSDHAGERDYEADLPNVLSCGELDNVAKALRSGHAVGLGPGDPDGWFAGQHLQPEWVFPRQGLPDWCHPNTLGYFVKSLREKATCPA